MMNRILVIDKDATCLDIVSFLLESQGFQVEGYESLSRVFSVCGYDLIIVDEDLGDEKGSLVCFDLKNTPELAHIPVIVIADTERLTEIGAECEADFLLERPFAAHELESAVANLLGEAELEEVIQPG